MTRRAMGLPLTMLLVLACVSCQRKKEEAGSALLSPKMRELVRAQRREKPPKLEYTEPPTEFPPDFNKIERLQAFEAANDPTLAYDIVQYANEVKEKLGKFDSFSVFQSGTHIIPITLDGVELQPGQHMPDSKCDRPPLLGLGGGQGQAIPYARVGRLAALKDDGTPNPDVDWVFISRRYRIRTDPNFPKFEDVAVIGHNRTTGDTAFFQMLDRDHPKDATNVPSPMDATPDVQEKARAFWLTPQQCASIGCYQCHTGDAWIHSPYIDQVTLSGVGDAPEPIVPRGSNLAAVPPYNPPYRFVGTQAFNTWPAPMQFKPAGNQCVKCHRIGTDNTRFIRIAAGRLRPEGESDSFAIFPKSHWMPPGLESDVTQPEFDALYGPSIDQLLSFIANPTQPGANPVSIP